MSHKVYENYIEWSITPTKKQEDSLTLDNPYAGKYLFQASYATKPGSSMGHLLSWEYGRIWNREHKQYVLKRSKVIKEEPKHKPDVYYRRRLMERMARKRQEVGKLAVGKK